MKKTLFAAILSLAVCACTNSSENNNLTKSGLDPDDFKTSYNGKDISLLTLKNESGMEVCITNFGGRIVSVMVPDRNGEFQDVVLGFDKASDYFPENNDSNFGAVIGRYGNRINQGRITVDGVEYQLPQNNYGHCLHGGDNGWHYSVFDIVEADDSHVKLALTSPDGDNNLPGEVNASVTYTLTESNAIEIEYEAVTDRTTVINMTNHSYFNLSGKPESHSICDDLLYINASNYTPVDSTFMTTGEILPVEGTPMDFRTLKSIGADIDNYEFEQIRNGHGFDHNWVLDDDAYKWGHTAAKVCCPESGIVLSVITEEPGIQVYAGNFLNGTVTGKKGVVYEKRHAICLETQHFPDTPNKPQWPSALLRPGEVYHSYCCYGFSLMD